MRNRFRDLVDFGRYGNDLMASVVVFLVALPLCMGIAIASGVPPAAGLLTGIIGGLVVGAIAGSPLQVSGPAAGLVVLVWDIVQRFGLAGMGIVVLLAGLIQLSAGVLRLGQWFRAVPPALIQGMLAGIGVLILSSQFHVMLDHSPLGSGIANLLGIPEALHGLIEFDKRIHATAAWTGAVTISTIILWNRFRPGRLKVLPAPLIGVVAGSVFAGVMGLTIRFVDLPQNLLGTIQPLTLQALADGMSWPIIGAAVSLAFIASAESLLCATAVDQMHKGVRTHYDRELTAQGVGNLFCGFLGALPMTGVIVRSTANVQAGATTRLSAVVHGVWILIFAAVFPSALKLIPTAALAGILVFTGYKLLNIDAVRELRKQGKAEVAVYLITLSTIVVTDLLTGVVTGFVISVLKTLHARTRLNIQMEESASENIVEIRLKGAATFMALPKLASTLDRVPMSRALRVRTEELEYLDHACLVLLENRKSAAPHAEVDLERWRA